MKKIIQFSLIFTIIGSIQHLFATKNELFDHLPKVLLVKIALETDLQTIGRLHQTSKKTNEKLKDGLDTVLKVAKEKGQAVRIYSYEGYTGYEKHFETFRECMEESKNSFKDPHPDLDNKYSPTEKFFITLFQRSDEDLEFGKFLKYILPHYLKGDTFYNSDLFKFQRTIINPLFEELLQKPSKISWEQVFQENTKISKNTKNNFHYPTSILVLQFFFDKGVRIDCSIKGNDKIDRKIITSFPLEDLLRKNNPLCNVESGEYVAYPVVHFLLNKGANVNECNFIHIITPIDKKIKTIPLLLDAIKGYKMSIEINSFDLTQESYKLIDLLLKYGADMNMLLSGENKDKTIYDYVMENQEFLPGILELLEEYRK